MAWPVVIIHALIPVGVYLATRLIDLAITEYQNQGVVTMPQLFDVIAVDLETNKVRIITTAVSEDSAYALETMTIERQGCEKAFFAVVETGTFKQGDEWNYELT